MMMRVRMLILVVLAVGCRQASRKQSEGGTVARGDVAGPPVTAVELSRFGVLPRVMAPPGMDRTPAQIELGRTLFYENVLSDGHDLSCGGADVGSEAGTVAGSEARAASAGNGPGADGRGQPR